MAVHYADTHLHELAAAIRQAGPSPDDRVGRIVQAHEATVEGILRA